MAHFTVYLDDSGTAPSQRVAICTALIIPASRLLALEREWDAFKAKEGFTDFHTSEFVWKNYKSEFAKWDDTKQQRVWARVRQIILKFGVTVYSFSTNKKDYDEVFSENAKALIGNHYTWAIRHTIRHTAAWRHSRRVALPLEYVFDWLEKNDPGRKEIEHVMEQAETIATDIGLGGEYSNSSFRRRKDLPGLQCVDAIAWSLYQIGVHAFHASPIHPFAELMLNDLISRNKEAIAGPFEWFTSMSVSREQLEYWMNEASADSLLISQFRDLEKRINEKRK